MTVTDLDALSYDPSDPARSFDWYLKRLQAEAIVPRLAGTEILDLGCGTGELVALLRPHVNSYHVIEATAANIERTSARVPGVTFSQSRWEDADYCGHRYSDVVASGTLEHAPNPVTLLRQLRQAVPAAGRLHVVVPNGRSVHRLLGVELGLHDAPESLTPADEAQGHWRNYTPRTLSDDLERGGWRVCRWRGIGLKFLSGSQMLDLGPDLIRATNRLADRTEFHRVAAELCFTATPER